MSVNYYNAERYADPTAYEALTSITSVKKHRKKISNYNGTAVFICSPYAGETEKNIVKACEYCKFAVSENRIPYAPHLLFPQFLDENDPAQRELGIRMGLVFLQKCREVWVFGTVTAGMRMEINLAQRCHIPIRYFNEKCEEVSPCET